jgi:hypothetical protein
LGVGVSPVFFNFYGTQKLFGFFGVVPKIRCKGFFFFLNYFVKLTVDVKDASSTPASAPEDLSTGLM